MAEKSSSLKCGTTKVKKVILTRLEELPMKQRMQFGMSGRAVIEVSKCSPLNKEYIKLDGKYSEYFEEKIKGGQMTGEQIREIGKSF